MHPPETEPTRMPSSRIAASDPGGRGLAPKVCATVSNQTRRPERRHSSARSSTSRSRLCMARWYQVGGGDTEEVLDGAAVIVEAGTREVMVPGAFHFHEALGRARRGVKLLSHLEGHDRIARAVRDHHGHLELADLGERVETLRE